MEESALGETFLALDNVPRCVSLPEIAPNWQQCQVEEDFLSLISIVKPS